MRFDSGRTGGQELGAVGARRAITLISTIIIIVVVVSSSRRRRRRRRWRAIASTSLNVRLKPIKTLAYRHCSRLAIDLVKLLTPLSTAFRLHFVSLRDVVQ